MTETLIEAVEIFALVTGVIYVILEILQKNFMWVVGIATGIACAWSFAVQHLYASMALNVYYITVSVAGLYQWRKDSVALEESSKKDAIHLNRLTLKTALLSLAVLALGTIAFVCVLRLLDDPSSVLDAAVAVLSAVATWWLAKSYPEQWLLWIVADTLSLILCFRSGMVWMGIMYVAYTASAFYGFYHWRKEGRYVS